MTHSFLSAFEMILTRKDHKMAMSAAVPAHVPPAVVLGFVLGLAGYETAWPATQTHNKQSLNSPSLAHL